MFVIEFKKKKKTDENRKNLKIIRRNDKVKNVLSISVITSNKFLILNSCISIYMIIKKIFYYKKNLHFQQSLINKNNISKNHN